MTKEGYFQRWFVVSSDEKRIKPASYRDMLRYATTLDYLLLFVGVTSAFLNGVTYPLNTLAFQGIINYLTDAQNEYDNGDIDKDKLTYGINKYAWMYFGIGCVIFVLTFLGMSALYILCEKQVQQIRKRYLQSILNQDVEWFDQNEVGALTHKMTSNVDKIKSGASDKLIILLQAAGALFCGIGIAFYLSWRLAIIVMIIVPIVIINLYCAAKAVTAAIHKEMSAYSAAGAVAEEVLHGIRTVTAFNAQSFEVLRYETHLKRGKTAGIQKAAITSFFNGLYNVILFGAMGVCFWYGTQLVVWGYAKPGTAFSAFWAIVMGAIRIGMALPQISVILGAKVAAAELFEIIDRKPKLNLSEDYGEKLMNVEGDITFSNVGFSYPTRPEVSVLNDVSFSVKHGETVALVGHSGCGKSTIINLLLRYYDPSSGNISIDGVNLNEFNVQWLRKVIGVVSQDHVVFHATIAENLRYGNPDASEADLVTACRTANAHEFIEKLPKKYDTFIGDGGIKLSGGQKQRLSIARILLRQPKILLLDEATSALDTESEKLVQSALDIASSGRTTVTVAHRLSTVRNADKILVFDFGKIIEIGNHDELMESQGTYYKMIQAQQMKTEIKDDVDSQDYDERDDVRKLSVYDVHSSNLSLHNLHLNKLDDSAKDKALQTPTKSASLCTILKFARPELTIGTIGLIMAMLQGAMWPAFSLLYGRLFLVLSGDRSKAVHDAAIYGTFLAVVGFLGGITTFTSGSLLGTVGESVAMRLRLGVYKNILRQDCEYFDQRNHGVGVLTARLAEDASNVQAAIDQRLAEVLEGITTLTLGIVIGFVVSWRMAPFCIALTLLSFFLQTRIAAYLKRRGAKDAEIAEESNKITAEAIENVKTIQALTHQSNTLAKFESSSTLPYERARLRGIFHAFSAAISQANIWINIWACYLFGLFLIKTGSVSPYDVFQTIEALIMSTVLITNTVSYFPEYIKARISAGIMFDMMRTEPTIDSASDEGSLTPIEGKIELHNVQFSYPNSKDSLTLDKINLKADSGETIALVGASGSGKSTVIQLLERFYDNNAGNVLVDGQLLQKINVKHLRHSIALVSQEPTLFNLSIKDNIAYGVDSDNCIDAKIREAAKLANISGFVEHLPDGYDTKVGGRGSQLSGGQRQRIAIARAMFRKPRILLLDEATAALDSESEKSVQEALDRARHGRTCITVAHRLSTIQNADRIYVIDDGKCIESGTHSELLELGHVYSRLVSAQRGQ